MFGELTSLSRADLRFTLHAVHSVCSHSRTMTYTYRGQGWYFQGHAWCFHCLQTLCSPYTSAFVSLERSQFRLPLVSLCLQVFDPEIICGTFWATHSSVLAGRSPWTEEPGGPHSTGLPRVEQDRTNLAQLSGLFSQPSSESPG